MHKIIIADDEKLIREGLRTIIPWEKYGFQVAGTARDGRECLDLISTLKPAVCIVDIRMPGKTGLEVIEEVRGMKLAVHFIILSGYKDFDYAKQAITYNVENYLLKPIDEDELVETLLRITGKINETGPVLRSGDEKVIIQEFFRYFLGFKIGDPPRIENVLVQWESYQLLLLTVPQEKTGVLDDLLMREDLGYLLVDTNPNVIILKKNFHREPGLLALNNLFGRFSSEHGIPVDGCLGRVVTRLDGLKPALKEVNGLMERRFFSSRSGITCCFDFEDEPEELSDLPDIAAEQAELTKLIEVGSEARIRQALQELSRRLRWARIPERHLKDWYSKLCIGALEAVLEKNRMSRLKKFSHLDLILKIQKAARLTDLEQGLLETIYQIIDKQELHSHETLVKKMKFLIESHYQENIKIKDLSDILHYNSAYLGKVFRSRQGESFNTYLDKVRIEKAKELLKQGYKVYQAAENVGYAYVDYFHTKFRKYVGMSPLEYRKKLIRE